MTQPGLTRSEGAAWPGSPRSASVFMWRRLGHVCRTSIKGQQQQQRRPRAEAQRLKSNLFI